MKYLKAAAILLVILAICTGVTFAYMFTIGGDAHVDFEKAVVTCDTRVVCRSGEVSEINVKNTEKFTEDLTDEIMNNLIKIFLF